MKALLEYLLEFLCMGTSSLLMLQLYASTKRKNELRRLEYMLAEAARETPAQRKPLFPLPERLERKLIRAGLQPGRKQICAVAVAFVVTVTAICTVFGVLPGFLAAACLVATAWAAMEWRTARRLKALSDCMLGFLERMRQLLAVGNSLAVALVRASENSPPIMVENMASTLRRIDNGSGVSESLERCASDLELYEMYLLATAARTNLRFGGSMTTILRNIMENIQKRSAIERELRANTTQIRISAWVLGLLPILIATLVMLTNPGYSHWFLINPAGHAMILYAIASQLIGAWCMRLITRTRY
jgi:tight adherence protein B